MTGTEGLTKLLLDSLAYSVWLFGWLLTFLLLDHLPCCLVSSHLAFPYSSLFSLPAPLLTSLLNLFSPIFSPDHYCHPLPPFPAASIKMSELRCLEPPSGWRSSCPGSIPDDARSKAFFHHASDSLSLSVSVQSDCPFGHIPLLRSPLRSCKHTSLERKVLPL